MLEIKLPKCLTEKERNIIRRYNESILSVLTEEERNRKIPRFLASVDNPTRGPYYRPFKTLGDIDTDTECFDQKLYKGLLDAVKENSFCNAAPTPEITLLYFNGAYAMAIHSLNHKNPELYYEEHYRNIWWTGEVDADWGNRIDVTMEHICACMVYRILEYEKNPRYDLLLQEIKHLIENSYFVEHNTLDCFKLTEMGEGTSHTPPTTAPTKRGRPKEKLFDTTEKEIQMAELFRNFLIEQGYELRFTENMNDEVNKSFLYFYEELDWPATSKNTPCFRFLTDACQLKYQTNCKEHSGRPGQKWCREFGNTKDKELPSTPIQRAVKEYLKKHKLTH